VRIGGNEHELVIRLRAGDDSAFVELVECYHARLVRLATVFVRRSELAEDVRPGHLDRLADRNRPLRGTIIAGHLVISGLRQPGPLAGRA